MNFLELTNRLRRECGVSGPALAGFDTLSLESQRMADWIADAWLDIQAIHTDWQFLRKPVVFNAAPQKLAYSAQDAGIEATFGNWKRDSFTCSSPGQNFGDEGELPFLAYDDFQRTYQFGAARTTYTRPVFVTVTPDNALALGPAPDQDYLIAGEYYARPIRLSAATDTPDIPEQHHMMIVFKAMMAYGAFEAAQEVYGRGELEYRRMLRLLEIDRLPTLISGPPLA